MQDHDMLNDLEDKIKAYQSYKFFTEDEEDEKETGNNRSKTESSGHKKEHPKRKSADKKKA